MSTTPAPLRPTFDLDVRLAPEHAAERLAGLLATAGLRGRRVGNHLSLTLDRPAKPFWSPWLTIEVERGTGPPQDADAAGRARVHARFHPHPSIWTAFMLTYIALATIALFALSFGISQVVLDQPPVALWLVPVCLGAAAAMYASALVGQRLAADQMHELKQAVEHALAHRADAPG